MRQLSNWRSPRSHSRSFRHNAAALASRDRKLFRAMPARFEALENRQLLSLLGVTPGFPNFPLDTNTSVMKYTYNSTSQQGTLLASGGVPQAVTLSPGVSDRITNGTFAIDFLVNSSGGIIAGQTGPSITISGSIAQLGVSGTLLQGTISQFGYLYTGTTTNNFDATFTVTGGQMASDFTGQLLGISFLSERNTFTGSFTTNWAAGGSSTQGVDGTAGPVPPIVNVGQTAPSLTTIPGGAIVMGSGVPLTDTAFLSGGTNPTGSITFALINSSDVTVDMESVPVNGNGTYNTPNGFVPTVASGTGTYQWEAMYSGDVNNLSVGSPAGSEPELVSPASPAITTTPSLTSVTLGASSVTLNDTAVLSGGFGETGMITFTLVGPGNTAVDTETATVSGNGSYTTPTGYTLPATGAVTGLYQWNASYGGDTNNNSTSDSNNANEQVTISPASPAITTTPSVTSVTLGTSSVILDDTAVLSGGYSEMGSITFNLVGPNNLIVDTETVPVSGNGNYSTLIGYALPTAGVVAGLYQWDASYTGDSNNNPASDSNNANEQVTISPASPAITTTPSVTSVTLGTSSVILDDTAVLSGGYNETGSITFNLVGPNNLIVDTETVPVSGNGNYSTLIGYALPTAGVVAGLYQWDASYAGDSNNNQASDTNNVNEQVTVSPASPAITTTPGGTVIIGSGTPLTDNAMLSGGDSPTGMIVFTLYGPNGAQIETETVTVTGNGIYSTPHGYVPTVTDGTGTYEWAAAYSGDSNNNPVSSPATAELEVVSPASPAITTTPGGTVVIGSGTPLTDNAMLSGGDSPTGMIVFTLYGPNGAQIETETVTVTGNGTYSTPHGYVPTVTNGTGTYEWAAAYSGDSNNNPVSSPATAELEVVSPASPAITTTPGGTVVIGSGTPLTDNAMLSGGDSPTGMIVFTLYGPNGAQIETETVTVTGNGTYSTPHGYIPTVTNGTGTYEWAAAYSGDSNNNPVSSPATAEIEAVSPASPAITTTPGGTVIIGSGTPLTDNAMLSGGDSPTGMIVFTLYGPNGAQIETETVTVTGNGTYSTPHGYVPTVTNGTGTYEWAAAYSGDSNNKPVSSPATAELEVVSAASPAITTTPGGTIVIGSGTGLTDTAILSGGDSPTGKIVFTLYGPNNAVITTETATVTGNGSYTTPTGYVPTVSNGAGTYEWAAAYSGDTNNNAVASPKTAELEVVNAASPAITTTPGGSVALGSGAKLTDSATLTGGDSPTGMITFTLYSPSGAVVDTETATVTGNGTYSTPSGFVPTTTTGAGTYEWAAAYTGDSNNNPVSSPKTAETEVVTIPQIDLSIVKTENTSQTCLGNNVTYTVTITNAAGYGTATGVTVSDMLPSGLTYVSGVASQGTYSSTSGVWSVGSLAGGASATLTVTAKTSCYGVYVNTACVTGAGQTDVGTNLQSSVTLVVGASLNGEVYQDVNGDCQVDAGDSGVAGVTVELIDSYGKVVLTTLTNSNGLYSFLGVAPGTYTVEFIAPTGDVVDCVNGNMVSNCGNTYGSGSYYCGNGNYDGYNYGCNNNISGCGNYDFNYGGQTYCGYTGSSNNCGYNYNACGNGGSNCSYSYTYCDSGNSNWGNFSNNCGNNNNNNNCNNNTPCGNGGNIGTGCVTLVCGTTTNGYNAGLYLPASIGNFVWVDANGNGLQDSNEVGLKNVTVELLNSTGKSVLQTTTTNSQGYYEFTNLAPGQYVVEFVSPSGYVFTTQGVGSNNAINSSANVTTGKTNVIALTSGEVDNNVDAGLYQPACVSGTVYVDYNNNGKCGGSDVGLSGVTVQLLNSGGQVVATTVTNSSGNYSFTGIAAGTYTLYIQQSQSALSGYTAGKDTVGTVNGSTDGTLPATDTIGSIVLTGGNSGVNYNFGQTANGQTLSCGDCGSISFWCGQSGQNLLNCLNGNSNCTNLGNWLCNTYGNLFGKSCGSYSCSGKTNAQICQLVTSLCNNSSTQCNAQILCAAINCYVTNSTLCGTVAAGCGFNVSSSGCGGKQFNVWCSGSAFGSSNYYCQTVTQMLTYCNSKSSAGNVYCGNTTYQSEACSAFTACNQAGNIGTCV